MLRVPRDNQQDCLRGVFWLGGLGVFGGLGWSLEDEVFSDGQVCFPSAKATILGPFCDTVKVIFPCPVPLEAEDQVFLLPDLSFFC